MDLNGDKALNSASADRLGFAATAEAIAAALLRQPAVDGLVVGIEGRWGSGKSSLVNMTVEMLRKVGKENCPEVVEFRPWLIGDRDSLLLALFTELAIAVDAIEEAAGDAVGRRRRQLGETSKKVAGFATKLGGLGALAKAAGVAIPGAGLVGEGLEALANAAKGLDGQRSIAAEKAELRERLRDLPRPIVITIDDVDRLEPNEVVEILRLVRSVADFPNVTYVLCYDPSIISHSIEVAARVENGRAYIEKIVQVAIGVPRPEAFDLRRWFNDEIAALPHSYDEAGDWKARLAAVIDIEGNQYLTTPRHVVRCLDGIRFFWGALQDQVDLGDLTWLHLVKVGNPELYGWVERYLPEVAAQMSDIAGITDQEMKDARKRLNSALRADGVKFKNARFRLSEFLPGISDGVIYGEGDANGVHERVSREDIARSVRDFRLASPDHYRLYFAVQQPRNAPKQQDIAEFASALDKSAAAAVELLKNWQNHVLSVGATKSVVILSRVVSAAGKLVGPQRAGTLIVVLGETLDDLAGAGPDGLGDPIAWLEGRRALRMLLPTLGPRRDEVVSRMFRGKALDWLTTIFRSETFAHGRVEGERRGEAMLSSDELDRITEIMIDRYRKLKLPQWKALRRPGSALFAWLQSGDVEGVKAMIAAKSKSDSGFLSLLEIMSGRVSSSTRGRYSVLNASSVVHFLDYDEARARTQTLAESATPPTLRRRAEALLQQFAEGEHR